MRGTVFLYQGEELGLPQSTLAFEDLRDPFGIAHWPQNPGRDGCRTPFPWQSDAPQLGFSDADRPWLPVDPAHARLAVDRQLADPMSVLNATKALLALRRAHPALRLGSFEPLVVEGDVLVLRRCHREAGVDDALCLAFNLGSREARLPWPVATLVGPTLFVHQQASVDARTLVLPPGAVLFSKLH